MSLQNELFIKCVTSSNNKSLFLFPHAGATPASYIAVLKKMNIDCNVHVLSLPGRLFQDKKTAFIDFNHAITTIKSYIDNFTQKNKDHEVYLFGHSMGSLFSYELAKYLSFNHVTLLKAIAISSLKVPDHRFRSLKISLLDDKKFMSYVEEFHFIPDEIKSQPAFYSDVLNTLKNDFKLIDSYQEPLKFLNTITAKVIIYGFEQDKIAPTEDLIKWIQYFKQVEGPIIFQGGHFHIFDNLEVMLKKLISL